MSPTIEDGQQLKVLDYANDSASRGDIVVFAAPTSPERDFVKRIIGLPGETIDIDQSRNAVNVDGEPLSEPYAQGATLCSQTCTWTVPEAGSPQAQDACGSDRCYFVLGDNRQNSSDSRQGWFVPTENIVGYIDVD